MTERANALKKQINFGCYLCENYFRCRNIIFRRYSKDLSIAD